MELDSALDTAASTFAGCPPCVHRLLTSVDGDGGRKGAVREWTLVLIIVTVAFWVIILYLLVRYDSLSNWGDDYESS